MVKAIDIISEDRKKVVKNIIERIEEDGLEWKKGWSPEMVTPSNPYSKAKYKGRNVVKAFNSALNNEYKDSRWITFKQAEKQGWKVKKGAKSIVLEKWIFDKEEKRLNPETGKEEKIKVKLDKPVANYFRVFNAIDIEGIPPLDIKPLDKNETLEIAENIIKSSKVPIVEIAQPKAYYNPSENKVVMPLRDTFKSQESFLATALHEMVHSTGKKLDRDLSGKFGEEKYAKEELVAELGSLMLQGKLGIRLEDRQVDNHAAYLQSWVKVLKNDSNELFRAAEKAEKASELLYERYQEYVKEHNLNEELYKMNERDKKNVDKIKEQTKNYIKINFVEAGMPNREKYLDQILTKDILKELETLDKSLSKVEPNNYFTIKVQKVEGHIIPNGCEIKLGDKFSREENKEIFKRVEEEFQLMENRENIKNNETFRYYSTERELNVGNYPKENLIRVVRFDDKSNVKYTKNQAWGYVEYCSPLTGQQRGDFRLTSEEEISKIKIAGYEFKNYQAVNQVINEEKYIVSSDRIVEPYYDDKKRTFAGKTVFKKERGPGDIPITKRGEEFLSADKEYINGLCDTKIFDIKEKEQEVKTSEKIKNSIKESPYITTSEIAKKYNLDEKEVKEELSTLIKNKEVFYHKEEDKDKRFVDKKEFIESLEANKKEKENAKKENEERVKNVMKKIVNEPIPRGNYNALTGNEIITADHSSGDKRWLTKEDVRKHGIPVKENEQSVVTIMTHKEEEKLYVKPVEYYNVEQLHITKEIEKQFKPMKEKVIDKSKERGQGIGD